MDEVKVVVKAFNHSAGLNLDLWVAADSADFFQAYLRADLLLIGRFDVKSVQFDTSLPL